MRGVSKTKKHACHRELGTDVLTQGTHPAAPVRDQQQWLLEEQLKGSKVLKPPRCVWIPAAAKQWGGCLQGLWAPGPPTTVSWTKDILGLTCPQVALQQGEPRTGLGHSCRLSELTPASVLRLPLESTMNVAARSHGSSSAPGSRGQRLRSRCPGPCSLQRLQGRFLPTSPSWVCGPIAPPLPPPCLCLKLPLPAS